MKSQGALTDFVFLFVLQLSEGCIAFHAAYVRVFLQLSYISIDRKVAPPITNIVISESSTTSSPTIVARRILRRVPESTNTPRFTSSGPLSLYDFKLSRKLRLRSLSSSMNSPGTDFRINDQLISSHRSSEERSNEHHRPRSHPDSQAPVPYHWMTSSHPGNRDSEPPLHRTC